MIKTISYLSSPDIMMAVALPGAFSLAWLIHAMTRKTLPPELIKAWMLCVIGSYFCSSWRVTEDVRELYIVPIFFIFLATALYFDKKITPAAAFSLSFLAGWTIDMTRAFELALAGEVPMDEFFYGVGGAGLGDGLLFVPLASALLVHYVNFRRKVHDAAPALGSA